MKINFFIIFFVFLISCEQNNPSNNSNTDYRTFMRDFVIEISQYSKSVNKDFIIIPQNGIELVLINDNTKAIQYLNAIDANGQEDLFYGYNNDNIATPENESNHLRNFLDISNESGNVILVTDYCYDISKMNNSYKINNQSGYVSFAAPDRELNLIPDYPVYDENNNNINNIEEEKNFLYLLNPENYSDKNEYLTALSETNYDIIIMDLFFEEIQINYDDIQKIRYKKNGAKRILIAYMSIGEAEDYRYYWNDNWDKNKPDWINKENNEWEGNYKVKYWNDDWKNIIIYAKDSYLNKIINTGFDGVYLDIIDAYEYYE